MENLGVRFAVKELKRFEALQSLFAEIKRDKDAEEFRAPDEWVALVPNDIKPRFEWPTPEERRRWLAVRHSTPIAISPPSEQLQSRWNFYSVFESIENGEYDLLACEIVDGDAAEIRIDPHSYPYGGVGPFIALAEAFGFEVLGVNECGRYESRAELLGSRGRVDD